MLFGQRDSFIVNQARMFDGIIPARMASLIDCVPCACAATLATQSVRFFHNRLQLFQGVLRRPR